MGAAVAYVPGELGVHEPMPIEVLQVCPAGYEVGGAQLAQLRAGAVGAIGVTNDLDGALSDVDLVYTDCWPKAANADERAAIRAAFLPYQVTASQLQRLRDAAVLLPCPPVTRGEEVSADAMQSPRCENHAAKDCPLHVQNAIMEAVAAPVAQLSAAR